MMGKNRSKQSSLILWATFAALLLQNLVIPVMSTASFEEQKNYYTPDPNIKSPPTGSSTPPSHGTPSHATPSHGTPSHATPSHGSSSHGGTPPANCGNPPKGGQHHNPTPAPSHGGGYRPTPPTTPTPSTPSTPTIVTPPATPIIDPGTPSTPSISTPPMPFDPNSPPFTCDYWKTHPTLIWGLVGWWGTTVGGAFGVASAPGLGSHLNLLEALSNTHTDGLGELYRQGTASLLNSMVSKKFTYTSQQVKDNFVAALSSDKAAGAQAQLFKLANEGRLKPRA